MDDCTHTSTLARCDNATWGLRLEILPHESVVRHEIRHVERENLGERAKRQPTVGVVVVTLHPVAITGPVSVFVCGSVR